MTRSIRVLKQLTFALSAALLLAQPVGADVASLIVTAIVQQVELGEIEPGIPREPDPGFICHPDALLEKGGGHPSFAIEVRGDCAHVESMDFPPSDVPWLDVRWFGTYDYESGVVTEKMIRLDTHFTVYDVTLQCEPGKNPFIYTGSCTTTIGPANAVQGSLPMSGPRIDGVARQSLIDWENRLGETQEGEGMDLAPNSDPPVIVSPASSQIFPSDVMVDIAPSPRGVARSTTYELQFFFEKAYSDGNGTLRPQAVQDVPRVLSLRQPLFSTVIDWSANPDGIVLPASDFAQQGHWSVRGRMQVDGAEWGGLVRFAVGVHIQKSSHATSSGLGNAGAKIQKARPFRNLDPRSSSPIVRPARTPVNTSVHTAARMGTATPAGDPPAPAVESAATPRAAVAPAPSAKPQLGRRSLRVAR